MDSLSTTGLLLPCTNAVRDIQGALPPMAMVEYIDLWQRIPYTNFFTEPNTLQWRWTDNGTYTAKSCYLALFHGSTTAPRWQLTCKSWAPLRIKFFAWLALQGRCWTAAGLDRHGLPHNLLYLLCDQKPESMQHLIIGCPFSR